MARSKYQANDGSIHGIRMSAARLAKAGAAPSGDIDSPINVKVSKSNREIGLRPRGVRMTRPLNPSETDKIYYTFLPVLTATALAANGFNEGATVQVGSVDWKVLKRVEEDY
jgi:hypothetical protein